MTNAVAEPNARREQGAALVMTAHERDELRCALEVYLADLHTEIRHTDRYDFRQGLKEKRATLQGLLRQLDATPGGSES
jgi:hypothetical protein